MTSRSRRRAAVALALLLVLASCKRHPAHPISRTLHVSAQRLAQIRSQPYVKRWLREPGPAARLAGLGDDPWPSGILFLHTDPYLEELGFDNSKMIAEIDGESAQDIFRKKWGKSAPAFDADHYRDLIQYLFVERDRDHVVLTVYLDVPRSYDQIRTYQPKVEYWLIKIG